MSDQPKPIYSLRSKILLVLVLGALAAALVVIYTLIQAARRGNEAAIRAEMLPKQEVIKLIKVGCVPGQITADSFGYVDVLDARITVPCIAGGIDRDLVGRQFTLVWKKTLVLKSGRRVRFSVQHSEAKRTREARNKFLEENLPIKGSRVVAVPLQVEGLGSITGYFFCGLEPEQVTPSLCTGRFVTTQETDMFVNIHQSSTALSEPELIEVLHYAFSKILPTNKIVSANPILLEP
jgi:hypothetical protein